MSFIFHVVCCLWLLRVLTSFGALEVVPNLLVAIKRKLGKTFGDKLLGNIEI